jgi:hypothetical protein
MGPLSVKGLTWQGEEARSISANALTGNMLCTRHNSVLSGLDARAGQFYSELVDVEPYLRDNYGNSTRIRLFSGHDWLSKVLRFDLIPGFGDVSFPMRAGGARRSVW